MKLEVLFIVAYSLLLLARTSLAGDISAARAQVDWIRSKGGFFHPKLEIQPLNKSDPVNSPMGVFALENLPKLETLMIIPHACLLTSGEYDSNDTCDTARNLMKQRRLKNESAFAPYVSYLFEGNNKGQLPAAWSDEGQELLTEIIGPDMPPYDVTDVSFQDDCDGGTGDPFEEEAYHLVRRRSWDDKMLPVFDMCNHRNGRWFNVDSNSAHTGDDIRVNARRDIKSGEQLYLSYNECADCDFAHTYVLQHIIKDFGFVEQYPRRWRFPTGDDEYDDDEAVVFELDEKPDSSSTSDDDRELEFTWLNGEPDDEQIEVLREELQRVRDISDYVLVHAELLESSHEREVSLEFYHALRTALEYAVRKADDDGEGEEQECIISANGDPGTCTDFIPDDDDEYYDELEELPEHMEYNEEICDIGSVQQWDSYESIAYLESQYNSIQFKYSEKMKDTCLLLNDHLQACASFRPHYHEVFVHYPARYVDQVKRVAFLGGGDNMIVHEILKYPSLELVVGMELDHMVVRSSFANFGTQPHWDDERVQWWFGDASKSLLMLPEEYHGSFDLVLLDLQTEVAENLKVTEKLNIMQAAMLLLKSDGIIARNEDWEFGTSNPFTDYAVDLYYVDVPVICCQGITMGSNSVELFKRTPKDHKIDTLYLKPVHESKFDFWYHYRKSSGHTDKVANGTEWGDQQTGGTGILMVLEAEDSVIVPLKSPSSVQASISTALKNAGLTETSAKQSAFKEGERYDMVFILQEGYVVARVWPEHAYCAFDILLWRSIEKQNTAKTELIAAIGSKTVSAYRTVAGGMFGTSNGSVDVPQVNESSKDHPEDLVQDAPSEQSTGIDAVLGESVSFLENTNNAVVVVLCGEQIPSCRSVEVLAKEDVDMKVIPLSSCHSVASASKEEEASKSMYDCQQNTLRSLVGLVKADGRIGGIVIDPAAPRAMGQILLAIFNDEGVRNSLLEEKHIVLSMTMDSSESVWRRALLDRFRTDFAIYSPAHRAEVLFNNLELGIFSSGDDLFYSHLMDKIGRIETKTGLVAEVQSVKNGINDYVEDFQPSKTFSHDDYDPSSAFKQWYSQRPLGEQTIIQFASKSPLSAIQVKEALQDTLVPMKLDDELQIEVYTNTGDGCVVVALWSNGSIIVSWDGRTGVSTNLLLGRRPAREFQEAFAEKIKAKMTSMEDFPRGIGRVVNFERAAGSELPHWA